MCQVSVAELSAGDSLYVSLKVVWWSLCPLLQAKNMNPILLAATWLWLPVRVLCSDWPSTEPSLELSRSAQNYKTPTPSVAQPAHMLHWHRRCGLLSPFPHCHYLLSQVSWVMTASQITMTGIVSLWQTYHWLSEDGAWFLLSASLDFVGRLLQGLHLSIQGKLKCKGGHFWCFMFSHISYHSGEFSRRNYTSPLEWHNALKYFLVEHSSLFTL